MKVKARVFMTCKTYPLSFPFQQMTSRNNKRPNEGGEEALVRRGGNKMMVERRVCVRTEYLRNEYL